MYSGTSISKLENAHTEAHVQNYGIMYKKM